MLRVVYEIQLCNSIRFLTKGLAFIVCLMVFVKDKYEIGFHEFVIAYTFEHLN